MKGDSRERILAVERILSDKPVIDRIVVAKFKLSGAEQTKTMLAKWDGDLWCFPSDAPIDSLCIGWWPVPEEEQS